MYYSIPGRFAWHAWQASWLAGCIFGGDRRCFVFSSLLALRCGLRAVVWCGLSVCLSVCLSGLDGFRADRLDGVVELGVLGLYYSDGVCVTRERKWWWKIGRGEERMYMTCGSEPGLGSDSI